MWEDFYLPSQLLANKCRVLLSERFYWEFWWGSLGFSVKVYRIPQHPVWKPLMEFPFHFWMGKGTRQEKGLAQGHLAYKGKVHTRTSLLTLWTALSEVRFGHPEASGCTGSSRVQETQFHSSPYIKQIRHQTADNLHLMRMQPHFLLGLPEGCGHIIGIRGFALSSREADFSRRPSQLDSEKQSSTR